MKSPHTNVLVRMSPEMKGQLQDRAAGNRRNVTQEILARLKASLSADDPSAQTLETRISAAKAYTYASTTGQLPPSYSEGPTPPLTTNDNGPAPALTDLDRAMLVVFHTLPPEKQLALLSLFR